ncbi:MAG: anthranilate synthase component I family protein [Ruaniaceae bacterium]|nr:anthranilate synthase component I family protein [Ruaniaceae bacterium]
MASSVSPHPRGQARFAGRAWRNAAESIDVTQHPERLNEGRWIIVGTFEGTITAWRFEEYDGAPTESAKCAPPGAWCGPERDAWTSSMNRAEYCHAVEQVRTHIREGEVYQANICRVLSAPLGATASGGSEPDAAALARVLAHGNPAPYGGFIHVPAGLTGEDGESIAPIWIVSASPELFLELTANGEIRSSPIKGTATRAEELLEKDRAENVMITDLVRNDLQRVCEPGSIRVAPLLDTQHHPGLVHLVSTVHGTLRNDHGTATPWASIFAATLPPGSVSGAPKSSALRIIDSLETAPRGPYCGAIGWIDSEAGRAQLAVGIRTFWWERGTLRFGTGAGITWGSDPEGEWDETELKARRLVSLASGMEER